MEKEMWLRFTGLSGGAPDCPVSQRHQRQRSSARSMRDTWPAPTVGWCNGLCGVHQTVSGAPPSLGEQWSTAPNKEGDYAPDMLQWLFGGAPDCPVRHSTEGKDSLLCWSPTAPSCLGAIKGKSRCMEDDTKLSRNILRLLDFDSTHLILCVCDLSSIWVANSMCCVSSSSRDLCAWLCYGFESCMCCSPQPYSVLSLLIFIVRARDSKLWRFLATRKNTEREMCLGPFLSILVI
jgi:hypothetical protein